MRGLAVVDYPSLGLSYTKTKGAAELRAADFTALGRLVNVTKIDPAKVRRAYGYRWRVDWSKRAPTLAEDLRATLARVSPTQAEREAEGCDCGEFGGSPKTCPVHGYEGTDPDVRERARKLNPQEQDLFERMDARLVELDGLVTGYPRPLRLVRDTRADLHTLRFVRERR
jgi:hypothetical protein